MCQSHWCRLATIFLLCRVFVLVTSQSCDPIHGVPLKSTAVETHSQVIVSCMSCCCLQAKAGVIGLTKTVAKEWGAFNIRCNGLAYGFIATRLTADKGSGASMQVTVTPYCCQQYNTPTCNCSDMHVPMFGLHGSVGSRGSCHDA